jgi:hypothetical protein
LAVLLTATLNVFSYPGVEFGPAVLARPIWALVVLHAWRVVGQRRPHAWFALSIESGLLLLTTPAAGLLLALLVAFMLATRRSRQALRGAEPWYALAVIAVMVVPYAAWLLRFSAPLWPSWPSLNDLPARGFRWGVLVGQLLLATVGMIVLVLFNSSRGLRSPDEVPLIYRPPVDPLARRFVLYLAVAPALVTTLVSALFGLDLIFGGAGTAILVTGLAVIVLSDDLIPLRRQEVLRTVWALVIVAPAAALVAIAVIQPWISSAEVPTALPTRELGQFFGENFERRTGQPLQVVTGDPELAALVALGAKHRPHVLFVTAPERTPWLTPARLRETGGLVVWRAADTAGTPPADIARQFPDLAPEVPRAFERMVSGRQPLLRVGWAIMRPAAR